MEEEPNLFLFLHGKTMSENSIFILFQTFALFYSSVINGTCPYFTWGSFNS